MGIGSRLKTHKMIALVLFMMFYACGRNETASKKDLVEKDGHEIVALMAVAQEALAQKDSESFQSLFSKNFQTTARTVWERLIMLEDSSSAEEMMLLTSYPELERTTTDVHVNKLYLDMWFDLSRMYGGRNHIYQATWVFRRGGFGQKWFLENLRIERSSLAYGALLIDLKALLRSEFSALGMEWEESIDPTHLLINTLQAMADGDIEALKAYTVDGTLFYAHEYGIELPTVANDDSAMGKHNREQSLAYLQQQVKNLKQGSGHLKVNIRDLEPYFIAYSVVSMPQECTKLKLAIEFDGRPLSKGINSFILSWAAVRLNDKWLAQSMGIHSIQIHRSSQ